MRHGRLWNCLLEEQSTEELNQLQVEIGILGCMGQERGSDLRGSCPLGLQRMKMFLMCGSRGRSRREIAVGDMAAIHGRARGC